MTYTRTAHQGPETTDRSRESSADAPPTIAETDHAWANRRLILASLSPRAATRPARHASSTAIGDHPAHAGDTHPRARGLGLPILARVAGTGRRYVAQRIPPERRLRLVTGTAAATVILLAALSGVRYLAADTHPPTRADAANPAPPAATPRSMVRETILTRVAATDACPKDANHADANRAVDGDLTTAWICTRSKNQDGQVLQISFDRQVTLSQIRVIGGFDATTPDGTDQWSKHRICTALEVWFPKDLKRDPLTLDTGGARDWRAAAVTPPATVSKLLVRVKNSSEPPQPATPTTESGDQSASSMATIAISEIQFIGTDSTPTA